jgi:hypothetical protein
MTYRKNITFSLLTSSSLELVGCECLQIQAGRRREKKMRNEKNRSLVSGALARTFRQWRIDHAGEFRERRAQ